MSNHPLTKLDFSLNISWNLLAKCVIYLPYSRGQQKKKFKIIKSYNIIEIMHS